MLQILHGFETGRLSWEVLAASEDMVVLEVTEDWEVSEVTDWDTGSEATEDTADMVDTADMADMVMASEKLRPAITTVTRATVVDMEEATDMAMDIMVRPALVQEFSA